MNIAHVIITCPDRPINRFILEINTEGVSRQYLFSGNNIVPYNTPHTGSVQPVPLLYHVSTDFSSFSSWFSYSLDPSVVALNEYKIHVIGTLVKVVFIVFSHNAVQVFKRLLLHLDC